MPTKEIIRQYLVPKKAGVSKAMFALWKNPKSKYFKPDLPPVVDLGPHSKGYFVHELDEFLESLQKVKKSLKPQPNPGGSA